MMTSSPFSNPAAKYAPWSAAVPFENATQYFAREYFASASSNCCTAGPCVRNGERSTLTTARISSSPIACREYGNFLISSILFLPAHAAGGTAARYSHRRYSSENFLLWGSTALSSMDEIPALQQTYRQDPWCEQPRVQ